MVIVKIIGGLGNQMFQYACGKALSTERSLPLLLDVSDFKSYTRHNGFELENVFGIKDQFADEDFLFEKFGLRGLSPLRKFLKNKFLRYVAHPRIVYEDPSRFNELSNTTGSPIWLVGHWQSEAYFRRINSIIINDFTFRTVVRDDINELLTKIDSSVSVSMHIRRGDYLSDRKTRSILHSLDMGYYARAMDYFDSALKHCRYFIFSDDLDWVRDRFPKSKEAILVALNRGRESFIDMWLMSRCKHHVIANSTFSWWGAWLGGFNSKIVIAPRKWYLKESNYLSPIPQGWVKL